MDTIIRNARIDDESEGPLLDIGIENGYIATIQPDLTAEVDSQGQFTLFERLLVSGQNILSFEAVRADGLVIGFDLVVVDIGDGVCEAHGEGTSFSLLACPDGDLEIESTSKAGRPPSPRWPCSI